jgi:hypothetical protein
MKLLMVGDETWAYEFDKLANKLRSGAFRLNRNRKNHTKVDQKSKSC